MDKQQKYKSFLLQFGYWAAILLIAVLFIKFLLKPLAPFLIALAVVMLVQPIVRKMDEKFKINKRFSSVVLVILCYLVIAGLLVLIIAGIVSVVVDWAEMIPDYFVESIQPGIAAGTEKILAKLTRIDPDIGLTVEQALPQMLSSISGSVTNFSVNILSWAAGIGTKIPGFLLATVICIISTVFLSLDYDHICRKILNLLPRRVREIAITAKRALGVILGKYLKSYALILLMTFAEIVIGLLIIGIKDAAAIAALIAVFDILPIVGSGMVLAPWAIISFIQGKIGLGIGLELLQDHGRDLLRRIVLAIDVFLVGRTHFAFDGADGPIRVGNGLALRCIADNAFIVLECDNGRCCTCALCVGDHDGFAALQHCHTGIRGTQINADNLCHSLFPPNPFKLRFLFLLFRNLHHAMANNAIFHFISFLQNRENLAALHPLGFLLHDCLMQIRVERALSRDFCEAVFFENAHELFMDEPHAVHPTLIGSFAVVKRSVKIVEHRQQRPDKLPGAFLKAIHPDCGIALAVIIKIRLQTLRHCDCVILVFLQRVDPVLYLIELIPRQRHGFRDFRNLFYLCGGPICFGRLLRLFLRRLFLFLCQVTFAPLQTYS